MANHIEKIDLEALEIKSYASIRSLIKNGDLLFCSGNYFVSKGIEKITSSPWSHVGILFNLTDIDRVLLLESVEDMGVRFAPVSKYLTNYEDNKPYDGSIVIARYTPSLSVDNVQDIAEFGIDQLTHPYDKDEVAEISLRVAFGLSRVNATPGTYICSELVDACFRKANIQFTMSNGFISPEDIWIDSRINLIARVQ